MQVIANWEARRSGASITVRGLDNQGEPIKLPNIEQINPVSTHDRGVIVCAVAKDGTRYELASRYELAAV